MSATASSRARWAGALAAAWALLVTLGWLNDPEHVRRLNLVRDALRLWSEAPYNLDRALAAAPRHLAAVVTVFTGIGFAWLAGCGPARWLKSVGGPLRLGWGLGIASLGMLGFGMAGLWQFVVFKSAALLLAPLPALQAYRARHAARVAGDPSKTVEKSVLRFWKGNRPGPVPVDSPSLFPDWVVWSAAGMVAVSAAVNGLGALAPETGYDSLIQHLADPRDYLAAHKIYFNDLSFLAQHPAGIEMLYAWLLPDGGDESARLLHWALGLGVFGGVRAWARRHLAAGDATVLASVVYLTPFMGILSARSYIDLGLMFYATLVLLVPGGSVAQGALLGLAVGTKYLGGLLLLGWLAALLASPRWRRHHAFAAGAAVTGGWWGVRNWLNTGNPVYPFAWKYLGGLGWDARSAHEYSAELSSYGRVTGLIGHLSVPWSGSVHDHGALDDGSLGPLWLVLGGFLMAIHTARVAGAGRQTVGGSPLRFGALHRTGPVPVGVAASVAWGLWFVSPRQIRYALMLLPMTMAAVVPALQAARERWPAGFRAAAAGLPLVLAAQLAISFSALYVWVNPLYVVLGMDTPANYLLHIVEPRDERTGESHYMALADWLPRVLPAGARTYMLGDAKVYYLPGRWAVNALFNPPLLRRIVASSPDAARAAVQFRQRGITHILYNAGGSIHIEYTHHLFRWTPREFGVVETLFRRELRPLGRRDTSAAEPIYMLFALAPGRYAPPPYLPGLDTRLAGVEEDALAGRLPEARAKAAALRGEYPGSAWVGERTAAALRLRPASLH